MTANRIWALMIAIGLAAACRHVPAFGGDADVDTDSDGESDTNGDETFDAVDMVIMVDNSGSMAPEQRILATMFFPLINSLVNPLPGWPYEPADSVRVGIVTSDMGLQYGGTPYDHDALRAQGKGWPDANPPPGCNDPEGVGDDGRFQTYEAGKTISLRHDTIPCDESAAQCPAGWSCGNIGAGGIGRCQAPDGVGADQPCPAPGPGIDWAETPAADQHNPDLAFQVACLGALGTQGCGLEQQLHSPWRALTRADQQDFLRDGSLLAVIMVTDEEDCSMKSIDLYEEEEIQDLSLRKVNIACNIQDGREELYLYPPEFYRDEFQQLAGGSGRAVFAAIVGVPYSGSHPGQEWVCQGRGNEIGQCLDHPAMQMEPYLDPAKSNAWFFEPVCERFEGDELVTWAVPGRRFVRVAQLFGEMGYVYSICNADWSPAMRDIAGLIAGKLE